MAIQLRPVQVLVGTGPRLGSGPLGSGGVGEPVGFSSGVSVGAGVAVGVARSGVSRAARLGTEVAPEPLGIADGVAQADGDADALGEGLAAAVHAAAARAIRTTAARQNEARLLPSLGLDPRSM
jgi:hypothetical protein